MSSPVRMSNNTITHVKLRARVQSSTGERQYRSNTKTKDTVDSRGARSQEDFYVLPRQGGNQGGVLWGGERLRVGGCQHGCEKDAWGKKCL